MMVTNDTGKPQQTPRPPVTSYDPGPPVVYEIKE